MTGHELFDAIGECCSDYPINNVRIIECAMYVEGKAYGDGAPMQASSLSASAFVLAIILASCGWPT